MVDSGGAMEDSLNVGSRVVKSRYGNMVGSGGARVNSYMLGQGYSKVDMAIWLVQGKA